MRIRPHVSLLNVAVMATTVALLASRKIPAPLIVVVILLAGVVL